MKRDAVHPASIYLFKVSNENTKTLNEYVQINNNDIRMTSLTVFLVNFELISHLVLTPPALALNK